MVVLTVLVGFFQEEIALFNAAWANHFTFVEFVLSLFYVGLGFLFAGILARYAFGIGFKGKVFAWTAVLAVCAVIGVMLLPDRYFFSNSGNAYYITESGRFRFGAKAVVDAVYLYFFFAVFPGFVRSRRTIDNFCRLFVIAIFAIIAYSVYSEWDKYVTYFTQTALPGQSWSFASFFMNKNLFGLAMQYGFSAAMYLHARYHRLHNILLMVLFTVYTVLIDCRTVMVIEAVLLYAYLVYRFFLTLKEHPWKNSLAAVLLLVLSVFVALPVVFEEAFATIPFLANFGSQIRHSIFGVGSSTMESRFDFWVLTMRMLSDSIYSVLFGLGGEYISYILTAAFGAYQWGDVGVSSTHNGFIFVVAKFGFIGFFIYMGLLVWLLINVIRLMKKGDRATGATMFIIIGAILHSFSENTMFFGTTVQMLCFLLLGIFPLLVKLDEDARGSLEPVNLPIGSRDSLKPLRVPYFLRIVMSACVLFFAFSASSPSLGFLVMGTRFGSDVVSYFSLGICALVLPRFLMSVRSPGLRIAGSIAVLAASALCFYVPGYAVFCLAVLLLVIGLTFSICTEGRAFGRNSMYYAGVLLGFCIPGALAFAALFLVGSAIRPLSDYAVIALLAAVIIGYYLVALLTPVMKITFPYWLYRGEAVEEFFATLLLRFGRLRRKSRKAKKLLKQSPARFKAE